MKKSLENCHIKKNLIMLLRKHYVTSLKRKRKVQRIQLIVQHRHDYMI